MLYALRFAFRGPSHNFYSCSRPSAVTKLQLDRIFLWKVVKKIPKSDVFGFNSILVIEEATGRAYEKSWLRWVTCKKVLKNSIATSLNRLSTWKNNSISSILGFSAGLVDDNDIFRWEVLIIGPPGKLHPSFPWRLARNFFFFHIFSVLTFSFFVKLRSVSLDPNKQIHSMKVDSLKVINFTALNDKMLKYYVFQRIFASRKNIHCGHREWNSSPNCGIRILIRMAMVSHWLNIFLLTDWRESFF